MNILELLDFKPLLNPSVWQPVVAHVQGATREIPRAWQITAPLPGPRQVVLGGIHGNERCGVYALRFLLEGFSSGNFSLTSGTLVVALGNEEALQKNVRYVGANLNRQFFKDRAPEGTSYECQRVYELRALLEAQTDFLLDLHATSAPSVPYAMIERPSLARTKDFGFPRIVSGWAELGDSSLAGDTQTFIEQLGGCAITMENGKLDDPASHESAIETVERVLSRRGVRGMRSTPAFESQVFHMTHVQTLERPGFQYVRDFSNLEPLTRGEKIGWDPAREYFAPRDYDPFMILPARPERLKTGENLFHFGKKLTAPFD